MTLTTDTIVHGNGETMSDEMPTAKKLLTSFGPSNPKARGGGAHKRDRSNIDNLGKVL